MEPQDDLREEEVLLDLGEVFLHLGAMLIAVRLLVGSRVGVPLEVKELAVLD